MEESDTVDATPVYIPGTGTWVTSVAPVVRGLVHLRHGVSQHTLSWRPQENTEGKHFIIYRPLMIYRLRVFFILFS